MVQLCELLLPLMLHVHVAYRPMTPQRLAAGASMHGRHGSEYSLNLRRFRLESLGSKLWQQSGGSFSGSDPIPG